MCGVTIIARQISCLLPIHALFHKRTWLCISFTGDCTGIGESSRSIAGSVFSSVSSTWSLVRFWPANIGEGSSFRGEVAIDVRFTGVLMTGKECLVCAGDKHALESFSPRIRRPSLTGLNCTAVEFIVQLVEVGIEKFLQ